MPGYGMKKMPAKIKPKKAKPYASKTMKKTQKKAAKGY